jgi:imidazolonepropionase-like amidohydrolase
MTRRAILLSCLVLAACGRKPSTSAPSPQLELDVVLENGRVIDGTGAAWFLGDVGIVGDRIARVGAAGSLKRLPAKQRIDVKGLVVSPGFIDIQSGTGFLGDSRSVSKVTQGITTEMLGEGGTPAPTNEKTRGRRSVRAGCRRAVDGRVSRPARLQGVAGRDADARHVAQRRVVPRRRDGTRVREGAGDREA